MKPHKEISPILHDRVRRGVELTVFVVAGWLLYLFGPMWSWPIVPAVVVTVMTTIVGFLAYRALLWQWFTPVTVSESLAKTDLPPNLPPKRYQVPRRFGIGTIGFATLVIAAILAALQGATEGLPPTQRIGLIGSIMAFFTIVSLMQLLMERVPRSGSVIAGVIFGTSLFLIFWGTRSGTFLLGIPLGAVAGYIGGVFVAGVFLVAEGLQRWWRAAGSVGER